MTWTAPQKLRDNTVITANYWNQILGTNGSMAYLTSRTNARAACTIFSANFTKTIPVTGVGSTSRTRINTFQTSSTNRDIPNRLYFNRSNGGITIPGNTPFLCIWSISINDAFNAAATGITLRTTLDLARKRDSGTSIFVVSASYLYKDDASQIHLPGAFGSVSFYNSDRYFLTFNHNSSFEMQISGTITLMLNPCLV
jgi:hypothetical protein